MISSFIKKNIVKFWTLLRFPLTENQISFLKLIFFCSKVLFRAKLENLFLKCMWILNILFLNFKFTSIFNNWFGFKKILEIEKLSRTFYSEIIFFYLHKFIFFTLSQNFYCWTDKNIINFWCFLSSKLYSYLEIVSEKFIMTKFSLQNESFF